MRHVLSLLGGVVAICAIAGCSGGTADQTAVSVGDVSLHRQSVAHWAKAIGAGSEAAASPGELHGNSREQALEFLISARWLIGEADERRVAASAQTVERKLRERVQGMPNGKPEFDREISSLGRTTADVKLEIEAELAAQGLAQTVSAHVPSVTRADAAHYYERHRAQFHVPEFRMTDLIEAFPTQAAAIAFAKRIGPGPRFAKKALHERVRKQTPNEEAHRDNGMLVHTIFAAKPGTVAGPVRFNHGWSLVVVRKILAAGTKPFAAVENEIAMRLTKERHRLARQSFIESFRRKWVARTDCRPGFVVQKCSQYRGRRIAEPDPLAFRTY